MFERPKNNSESQPKSEFSLALERITRRGAAVEFPHGVRSQLSGEYVGAGHFISFLDIDVGRQGRPTCLTLDTTTHVDGGLSWKALVHGFDDIRSVATIEEVVEIIRKGGFKAELRKDGRKSKIVVSTDSGNILELDYDPREPNVADGMFGWRFAK